MLKKVFAAAKDLIARDADLLPGPAGAKPLNDAQLSAVFSRFSGRPVAVQSDAYAISCFYSVACVVNHTIDNNEPTLAELRAVAAAYGLRVQPVLPGMPIDRTPDPARLNVAILPEGHNNWAIGHKFSLG